MEFLEKDFIGFLTFILSGIGLCGTLSLWFFIKKSAQELSQSLASVYFWDALRFLFTMFFGLAGWINAPPWFWNVFYYGRPFVLLFSIYALWRLYVHFRRIGKEL